MPSTISAPVAALTSFAQIRSAARAAGQRRIGIVQADDPAALTAASAALLEGIAFPVLFGSEARIRAMADSLGLVELAQRAEYVRTDAPAQSAVAMARAGSIDILMKGHLRTDELLHPILDRQSGLRTGQLLCDVGVFEFAGEEGPRLVAISDGGINVAPTLEQKKQIILGAVQVLHSLGIERPRVAVMSALEIVTDAMPSTADAAALTAYAATGAFGDAEVYGPLALDNALFPSAAAAKGLSHPVAGNADLLLMPNIEAGNMLAKSILFLANLPFAHVVAGARVPILIPSRVERPHDKLNAIALGVLHAAR